MKRTIISLEEDDKAWLDAAADRERIPSTELVRRAIKSMRRSAPLGSQPLSELLERTKGIWRGEDGLTYQRRLRDEW